VVYAVLFYSPTCPHCHDVIDNDLPGIQAEFGDQLQVLFINVATQGGQMLAQSAYEYYNIPRDGWVVPMMVINEQVLTGSIEIPQQMPEIVRTGLAQGGIGLPQFPGLKEAYEASQAAAAEAEATQAAAVPEVVPETTVIDRLLADPLANGLAVLVLVGLILSLGAVLVLHPLPEGLVQGARLVVFIAAVGVAVMLVGQGAVHALATPLAWGLLLLLVLGGVLFFRRTESWLVPLVAVVGLVDAAYLAYIEVTESAAVCGAVGDCNAVQQSAYAQIFGIPIGVLGLVAYIVVLGLWLLARRGTGPLWDALLFGLVLAGTAFSIYLTFLEPFVIGATCAWCLLSALTMLLLLWLLAPTGWTAVRQLRATA
jgi:uncharacterized membrane protein